MNKQIIFIALLVFLSLILSSCSSDNSTEPTTTETVTDIDGNVYPIVTIGSQVWLAENLKVTHYRNGDEIPNVTDNTAWQNLSTGAYCEYDNDANTVGAYGRYYNWYAVNDSRRIAPAGWRVPSDEDWQTLIDYLGGQSGAGGKMKETGTAHWHTPNSNATNESGMTIRGAGHRNWDGAYINQKASAWFWSSSEFSSANAWYRSLYYDNGGVARDNYLKLDGFSVRCIYGETPTVTTAAVTELTETTAACGGNVTSDGGAEITARGVCWSTNPTPTISDNFTSDGAGTGSFTSSLTGLTSGTPYYVRAYATNSVGTGYGDVQSFSTEAPATITDIDGNIYNTVTIGNQIWMVENLKVTHFRNGDAIPTVLDGMTWDALATPAYCKYDNSDDTVAIFGLLYNWYAVDDSRGIAPEGWHVPSEQEWDIMHTYLDTYAGGKLKETGTIHWLNPNEGATNETGFAGLPGGIRGYQGYYSAIGQEGRFWTTTVSVSNNAYAYSLSAYDAYLSHSGAGPKVTGYSIRCIKD